MCDEHVRRATNMLLDIQCVEAVYTDKYYYIFNYFSTQVLQSMKCRYVSKGVL